MNKPLAIILFALGLGLAIINFVLRVALNIQLPGGYFLSFLGFVIAALGLMYLKKLKEKDQVSTSDPMAEEKEKLRDFEDEDHSRFKP